MNGTGDTVGTGTEEGPRVALFLSGRVMGFQHVWGHLRAVLDKYRPTVFVSLNLDLDDPGPSSRAMVENADGFLDTIGLTRDSLRVNIEKTVVPEEWTTLAKGYGADTWSYRFYSMHLHNHRCIEMIRRYQDMEGKRFDIVIKYRADIDTREGTAGLPEVVQVLATGDGTVWVPELMNFGGCNDQIGFGTWPTMEKYGSLILHWERIFSSLMTPEINAETLIHSYLVHIMGLTIYRFHLPYWLHDSRYEHNPRPFTPRDPVLKKARIIYQAQLKANEHLFRIRNKP
jgi:hypothetical protein